MLRSTYEKETKSKDLILKQFDMQSNKQVKTERPEQEDHINTCFFCIKQQYIATKIIVHKKNNKSYVLLVFETFYDVLILFEYFTDGDLFCHFYVLLITHTKKKTKLKQFISKQFDMQLYKQAIFL